MHCAAADALRDQLDGELAENSRLIGKPLAWSAAELAVLELVATTIDRREGLQRLYEATEDIGVQLKLAAELRLIEAAVERLLRRIKTDLPMQPTVKSRKAAHAANVRWSSGA